MFHNVNGLSLTGTEGMDMFVNEQAMLDIDIQGITEHCLDTTKFRVYQTSQEIVRKQYTGQSKLTLHSSSEPAINLYKPGGTGFLMLGDTVSRQEPNGSGGDQMGRWSFVHLRRRALPPLTIITAYQVCPRPTNPLGNTAYHQQLRAINAAGQTTHPRQAFIRDLSEFISKLQAQGNSIILGGDFNESLEDKHSGILRLITTHNLIDPFLHRFPQHTRFGTHLQGSRRIDYVFVSPDILRSVRHVGYAPFQYAKPSDHRPILLELNTRQLFGYTADVIQPAKNRRVKSNDKVTVTKFITRWYQEISDRQGFDLQQSINNDSASIEVVELLDTIIGAAGDAAENSCRRRRPEFYSQQLIQQRLRVSLLRCHLQSLRLGIDRTPQLQQRMKRTGLDIIFPDTIRLTLQTLRQASNDLQETCRNNAEIRQQELMEKVETLSQRGRKSKAQILRTILKTETNRKTYQILQQMKRRAVSAQKIDRIEIPSSWPPPHQQDFDSSQLEDPKTCLNWKMITDPTEVEYYLLLRNRLHFGQAEGTPFTVDPLRHNFDWEATTEESNDLLQGTFSCTHTTPNCEDLLRACRHTTNLDSIPAALELDDFRRKIKIWKESTATSPSGRHLGRYKSLFAPGVMTEDEGEDNDRSTETVEIKQHRIASLILSVINYCIRNTYVLNRWKKVVNVMIFKEQGNFKIHRLRVIHIYEADFNLLLAVKWRQLLHNADREDLIHGGQYGGRPGCEAQSLPLLEELKYDLAYLTRRTLFNFDNDATSCYDRIIVSLASIVNRKYGLHHKVVSLHAKTLRFARYHIKTECGISTSHYTTSTQFPIHGTGQGSGNSPCIWLFISSTLFDVHETKSHGAKFISPDGKYKTNFSMVGFVDDSTGTCNDFRPNIEAPMSVLFQRMQHDAQLWNNLLHCSGGKLELPKCSFHVLRFDFRPNGTPIATLEKYDKSIHITDLDTNESIPIPSKRAFDTHKTLGHFKAPTSRLQTELNTLKAKAKRLAILICTSPVTRSGAHLAYHSVYVPSIRYVLPQSYFSRPALEKAQAASLSLIISKCGFNRHTAKAIMFAPCDFAGGGFLPWYLLQGEGQIVNFIKHWRTNTIISKTLKVAVLWAQWQSGHHFPIFEDTTTPIPYLECRWLKSLRSFLGTLGAQLVVDIPMVSIPERRHDIYIMTYARTCGLFSESELAIINYCRLYLHVTTVSELFDSEGTNIIQDLFHCRREPWFNQDTYITLQKRPSEYQIRMRWQKLCRQWTTSTGKLGASFNLGKWTTTGSNLRRRRESYKSQDRQQSIYSWKSNGYWEYAQDRDIPFIYHPIGATQWTPTANCTPVDVHHLENGTLRVTYTPISPFSSLSRTPTPRTFLQYINTLDKWEKFLLDGIQLCYQPYDMIQKITQLTDSSQLFATSDGSTKDTKMTYGWVFGSDDGTIYAKHGGSGLGKATSHRAESWGMLSVALFVKHLHLFTCPSYDNPVYPCHLTFLSDNSGLVGRVNQRLQYVTPYPNATLAPDWDIIEQIYHTIRKLPYKETQIRWVKGHQDDFGSNLSIEAQYNIAADELADQASSIKGPHNNANALPAAQCTLYIQQQMITGHYIHAIREFFTLPPYKSYIGQRHGWTVEQLQLVDWEIFQQAARNYPQNKVQLTKLIHEKLPTNREIAKANPHQSTRCQYCDDEETFTHLLQCDNPLSENFRMQIQESVTTFLTQHVVPQHIQEAFISCLELGLKPKSTLVASTPDTRTIEDQCCLGHRSIMKGFLALTWRNELTKAFQGGSEATTTTILAGLIKILWVEQLTFWESHLQAKFKSQDGNAATPQDKLNQYRQRIRHLHAKREQCLPAHREQYFHENVETFLSQATSTQMRQYLHSYEPAITSSIQRATKQPIRTILSFPGFIRTVLHHRQEPRPPDPQTARESQKMKLTSLSGARGAPTHHKHTRWRPTPHPSFSFKKFFSPHPD